MVSRRFGAGVSVLVGENGCGKSTVLGEIALENNKNGINTVAISNCIYDKYSDHLFDSKVFSFSGGRYGFKMARYAMVDFFQGFTGKRSGDIRKTVEKVLDYLDLDSRIGIKLDLTLHRFDEEIRTAAKKAFPNRYKSIMDKMLEEYTLSDGLLWVNLGRENGVYSFDDDYVKLFFGSHTTHETMYDEVELVFSRKGRVIPMEMASSGEIYQFVMFCFLASKITKDCFVLIDEPENSLHPRWQMDYIEKIWDVFYLYSPKIVIATHSPLILSSLEENLKSSGSYIGELPYEIFLVKDGVEKGQQIRGARLEKIILDAFGLITPENTYLSDRLVDLMNDYSEDFISYELVMSELSDLERLVTSNKQRSLLKDIKDMVSDG